MLPKTISSVSFDSIAPASGKLHPITMDPYDGIPLE